jgi:hypothetical protein
VVVANCVHHLQKLKFSKAMPHASTEYGAVASSNVLASPQAVEIGIYVVRAFVQLRQASAVHADLAKRLSALEWTTEQLARTHDSLSRTTREQIKRVFDALRELAMPADPPKRPIEFVMPRDDNSKP